jgi:hypothetical protein
LLVCYWHEDELFVRSLRAALDEVDLQSWPTSYDEDMDTSFEFGHSISVKPLTVAVLSERSLRSIWGQELLVTLANAPAEQNGPSPCAVAIDPLDRTRHDQRDAALRKKLSTVLDLAGWNDPVDGGEQLRSACAALGAMVRASAGGWPRG